MAMMTRSIHVAAALGMLLLLPGTRLMEAQQQQSKTYVHSDGSRDVFDTTTGWTETDKNGKLLSHMSVADLTTMCGQNLDTAITLHLPPKETAGIRVACDAWAQLQPHTQIEKVSFSRLIARLLEFSAPYTDFARYRGLELKSSGESTIYDAAIVPDDLGTNVSCTIEEENRAREGMLYTYQCSIKASSYVGAVALRDRLVSDLRDLHLTEDEIREHGLAADARNAGKCAPSGECAMAHDYVAEPNEEGKTLAIGAEPDFTRDPASELAAQTYGHDSPITGIAFDSATVFFAVYSVGPRVAMASQRESSGNP